MRRATKRRVRLFIRLIVAWDVHRAEVLGRCEVTTRIAPFDRLVAQVMAREP